MTQSPTAKTASAQPVPDPAATPASDSAPQEAPANQPGGANPAGAGRAKQGVKPGQKPGQKQGPKQGAKRGLKNPPPRPVVEVRPLAEPATMRKRHWGLMVSFGLLVLAPLAALMFYLWTVAEDQYSSTTGFTVRQEESTSATDVLGGLAQFAGTSTGSDSDILYEFIQSQEIVAAVDAALDIRSHYAQPWPRDFVFALWPEATIEDLLWYWQRMVRISYDQATGLIEVRALAFDPDMAQAVARAIVSESQAMINDLNIQAREDAMRYAREDLEESVARLKQAREALTQFRSRTQIVDPAADLEGRMGVMGNLQQQLAEALIEYDLVRETTSATDPRVTQALRRIEVIRQRIQLERQSFASADPETGGLDEDYPALIAEFESLSVDREFAEETYRAALAAFELARDNAARQSRYLAAYIEPTLAQTSEFPQRGVLAALAALFLLMFWSILSLIYYSIRDRG